MFGHFDVSSERNQIHLLDLSADSMVVFEMQVQLLDGVQEEERLELGVQRVVYFFQIAKGNRSVGEHFEERSGEGLVDDLFVFDRQSQNESHILEFLLSPLFFDWVELPIDHLEKSLLWIEDVVENEVEELSLESSLIDTILGHELDVERAVEGQVGEVVELLDETLENVALGDVQTHPALLHVVFNDLIEEGENGVVLNLLNQFLLTLAQLDGLELLVAEPRNDLGKLLDLFIETRLELEEQRLGLDGELFVVEEEVQALDLILQKQEVDQQFIELYLGKGDNVLPLGVLAQVQILLRVRHVGLELFFLQQNFEVFLNQLVQLLELIVD